jgi:beta-glucosidase
MEHPNITAIIYAGAPGEQTGPSLVDVMYGAVKEVTVPHR